MSEKHCAHTYEIDITTWGDQEDVFMCLHCKNKRREPKPHWCNYECWAEHHPQEFIDD